MKVADVMTRGVDFIDAAATVQVAATQMAEFDIGAILVGAGDTVSGILTDRDILVRVVVEGLQPSKVSVGEVMTADVVGCKTDDSIETAFAAMREGQFRRMPVFDEGGKPIGVVTLSDLARNVESPETLTETLREISEPHRSRKAPAEEVEQEPSATEGHDGDAGDAGAATERMPSAA